MSPDYYATTFRPLPAVELPVHAAVQSPKGLTGEEELEPQRPFPILSGEAMHGPIGALVREIEPTTEADPAGLLVQFLAAFGNAFGRSAYMHAGGSKHYPNLFVCLVGKSSKARKGTAWAVVRNAFECLDPQWLEERVLSGLSSGEGVIWAVRDPIYKAVRKKGTGNHTSTTEEALVDPGIDDKRLFVAETEFSQALRVMGRQSNTLSAVLRNAWDCGSLSTLTKNSPARATGAHVNVCGHITEEELSRELAQCEFFNGFANRFLWVCVRRSKLLAEAAAPDPGALRPPLEALGRALDLRSETFEVRREPAARELWAQIYEDLSEEGQGQAGVVTDRAEAQVLRLSLLYALADGCESVDVVHLTAALALWRYCEASAYRLFDHRAADPKAQKILDGLRQAPGGLSRTEINARVFNRNESAEAIHQALKRLRAAGLVHSSPEETGGRTAERWFCTTNGYELNE